MRVNRPRKTLDGSALADVLIVFNDRLAAAEETIRDQGVEIAVLRAAIAAPFRLSLDDMDCEAVLQWLRNGR